MTYIIGALRYGKWAVVFDNTFRGLGKQRFIGFYCGYYDGWHNVFWIGRFCVECFY